MAGARRSAMHRFQIGPGRGICDKLAQIQAARDASRHSASGRDLVPVKAAMVDEEEVAKLGLDLHARELGRGRRVLADAFAPGQAAGQRFEYRLGNTPCGVTAFGCDFGQNVSRRQRNPRHSSR